jgi:ribonuclease HI
MVIECFADGGSRGQGQKKVGEAACAVFIYKNRRLYAQFARGLGKKNNNEAEYEAVLHAILMCVMADLPDPIIYSDSAVVVNHVNGKWACSAPDLLPLLMSIKSIQEKYRFRLVQVPRELVHEPDRLVNDFLDNLEEEKSRLAAKKVVSNKT